MTSRGRVGLLRDRVRSGDASAAIVNLDVERSLVVVDDAARRDAVAAEVAALIDACETVCRVVAADEDVLQAVRRALTGERFDVVVLALSSFPDPGFCRDVARAVGVPVVWVPVSVRRRADPADEGQPGSRYPCSGSRTDAGRGT